MRHPEITPLKELRSTLSKMRLKDLSIGKDGKNRTLLSAFRSRTGRNQPSSSKFIFGASSWLRGLVKPEEGMSLAYIDWSQQEYGIAAALSGDENMLKAYLSGDPYLAFAIQAGQAPEGATKKSHKSIRDQFKAAVLAVQYGMGAEALANQLGKPVYEANRLLRAHKDTFPKYWEWNQRILDTGFAEGRLETIFGWSRAVSADSKPASVGNFPVQGNGAEMLRIAIGLMQNQGIKVCAPIHDAVLVEGHVSEERECILIAQKCMQKASEMVLSA